MIDVQLGFKYMSDKGSKYAVNFKQKAVFVKKPFKKNFSSVQNPKLHVAE